MIFSFLGEFLILIMFNFNTLSDAIPSSFLLSIKTHLIFYLLNGTSFLNDIIFFYIVFFTYSGIVFLLNFSIQSNYFYFKLNFFNEFLLFLVLSILFINFNIKIFFTFFTLLYLLFNYVLFYSKLY